MNGKLILNGLTIIFNFYIFFGNLQEIFHIRRGAHNGIEIRHYLLIYLKNDIYHVMVM